MRDMWFKDMVHGLYMTLKMQIRADRMAISLIRIRSVNTPDLQTRRKIWENDIIKYHYGDYYAPVKFGEYQSCFDSTTTCHVGFYVDWDGKRDFRKDLGYWIKMVDAEVVGNIHDKSEQQKDQRSTIICRDFMKKGRE